jgi:hypothetical protein
VFILLCLCLHVSFKLIKQQKLCEHSTPPIINSHFLCFHT